MSRYQSRRGFLSSLAVCGTFLSGCLDRSNGVAAPDGSGSWPTYRFDRARTGYDPDGVGPTDGASIRWRSELEGLGWTSPTLSDGSLFVGSFGTDGGRLTAVEAETGETEWHADFDSAIQAPPTITDHRVYVVDDKGRLRALSSDGETEWEYETNTEVHSALSVVDGRIYVGGIEFGSPDDRCDSIVMVDEIDPEASERNWRYDFNEGHITSPAVRDGRVYLGSNGAYALDAENGELLFHYETDSRAFNTPTITDAGLYASSWDGIVHAVSPAGDGRWTYEMGDDSRSAPAIANGLVVVGSNDGNVYALDAESGEERWRVRTGGSVRGAPAIVDETVYVGSADRTVYAVALSDGTIRWSVEIDSEVELSPIVAGGTVYVVDDGGTAYALAE